MGHSLTTVTEATAALAARGYDADFVLRAGRARCGGCGAELPAPEMVIDEVYRFEGPSDPGDEMIVVAVTCRRCGRRGTLASGYGPSTSPEEAELLRALTDGR